MNFENELGFFREILEKCHIGTSLLSATSKLSETVEPGLSGIIEYFFRPDLNVKDVLGTVKNKTKYMLTNEFRLKYVCFRIPLLSEKNILFIGPYLSSYPTSKEILEIGEKTALSSHGQRLLKEYCSTLPIIAENDRTFAVINAFCERIWQTASFAIEEFQKSYTLPIGTIDHAPRGESTEELLASAEMMEMRYSFENQLMRAVSLGQQHKEELLSAAFNDQMFEKRVQDPVRNAKNYCIIMNTLLRKAAEEGGVHPIHIDRLSSKFALSIEQISAVRKVSELMREMFSSYCRLVHKHSIRQYSPIVKRTVTLIDSDISAELSLGVIAKNQGVSPGYLATVFKRETGKTVSEYVRDKRMEYAKYLLSTTELQIQTVAAHCGIIDVQYFSKTFKKQVGKTPKEYRDSVLSRT